MNAVSVSSSGRKYAKLEPGAKALIENCCRALKKKNLALEVRFVSNAEMRALNRVYRGKDKSTNVLSFESGKDFPVPGKGTEYVGEVFLAPDHIAAKKEDLELMVIHGLLHLLGYTHSKSRDRIKMEKLENELILKFARE